MRFANKPEFVVAFYISLLAWMYIIKGDTKRSRNAGIASLPHPDKIPLPGISIRPTTIVSNDILVVT
jgi:hypothetical protein